MDLKPGDVVRIKKGNFNLSRVGDYGIVNNVLLAQDQPPRAILQVLLREDPIMGSCEFVNRFVNVSVSRLSNVQKPLFEQFYNGQAKMLNVDRIQLTEEDPWFIWLHKQKPYFNIIL
jgi:hypothetical protein